MRILLIGGLAVLLASCGFKDVGSLIDDSSSTTTNPSTPTIGITGTTDATSDAILKGSLAPTVTWNAIDGATEYEISVVSDDGTTVICPEAITSSTSYAFSSCTLTDKTNYKVHLVPSLNGAWTDMIDFFSFVVDALNLTPQSQVLLTGETLQISAINGTGPYTFSDGGTGYIDSSTGLLTVPSTASAQTLTVSVADSASSTNSTSVRVRAFSDLSTSPYFAPQQGDGSMISSLLVTSAGTLLAFNDVDQLPWMGYTLPYRSTDQGSTWTQAGNIDVVYYGDDYTYSAIQLYNNDILTCESGWDTVGGYFLRMRRSIDDGVTWADAEKSYDPSVSNYCAQLVQSPTTHTVISLAELSTVNTIRRSTDNGATWTNIMTLSGTSWRGKLAAASNGTLFLVDGTDLLAYKSTDDGLTWTAMAGSPPSIYMDDLIVLSDNTTLLVAGEQYGSAGGLSASRWAIYKSTDAGDTWTQVDYIAGASPTYEGEVYKLLVASDGSLLAGGFIRKWEGSPLSATAEYQYIRKSTDNGDTWSDLRMVQGSNTYSRGFSGLVQLSGGNIIATAQEPPTSIPNGDRIPHFYKSTDLGTTWTDISEIAFKQVYYLEPMTFTANSGSRMIVAGNDYDDMWTDDGAFVRTSVDGGSTWQTGLDLTDSTYGMDSTASAIDASGNFFAAIIKYGDSSNGAVITTKKSTDGSSWSDLNTWTLAVSQNFEVNRMLALSDGSLLTVGGLQNMSTTNTDGAIRKISAAGAQVFLTLDAPASGTAIDYYDIAQASDGTLWIAGQQTITGGSNTLWIVKKSTDGGSTWTTSESYQPTAGASTAKAMKIGFDSSGTLYVAGISSTNAFELHKSSDSGATWSTLSAKATGDSNFGTFKDFVIDGDDRLLISTQRTTSYESTDGGSVWHVDSSTGALVGVDQFARSGYYESEIRTLGLCGSTVCVSGVANNNTTGRTFFVRRLSN